MATSSGQQSPTLNQLLTKPQDFDFFQAVRLLECAYRHKQIPYMGKKVKIDGRNALSQQFIRFCVVPKTCFPVGSIENIQVKEDVENKNILLIEMLVTFMGLTGASGALPHHYSERLIYELHHANPVLKDFFDLFNHRILSLFYSAWEKQHFLIAYERIKNTSSQTDHLTTIVNSLSGMGTESLKKRFSINDQVVQFYSGLFARKIRSAAALEQMLSEYFELPIKVLQCKGKWLYLNTPDQSIIAKKYSKQARYNELGRTFILGNKHWYIQSKFRLYIGPVDYAQFKTLAPDSALFKALIELTRFYVGAEFDFDIQIELLAKKIPYLFLQHNNPMRLGWNTWLHCQAATQNSNQVVISI